MNTALIVEPRDMSRIPLIINHFTFRLGDTWKLVFYCGKGLKEKWALKVNKTVEIRELDTNNLNSREYSDLLKKKDLWDTLYGEYVLVFQTDAWIMNQEPYTIDYFIKKNVSYIGGNMSYRWLELNFKTNFWNYNGGLSLRKRKDMIKIIETFPPQLTAHNPKNIHDIPSMESSAEDVYFVRGCYLLDLDSGDSDESCGHFAIHAIFHKSAFGIHKPIDNIKQEVINFYPEIQTAYI